MDRCPLASLCVLGSEILVVSRNRVCGDGKKRKERSGMGVSVADGPASDLTVATVLQVGPDDVFLGEAEHAQPPASHAGVNDHVGVRHQFGPLKETSPGERRR